MFLGKHYPSGVDGSYTSRARRSWTFVIGYRVNCLHVIMNALSCSLQDYQMDFLSSRRNPLDNLAIPPSPHQLYSLLSCFGIFTLFICSIGLWNLISMTICMNQGTLCCNINTTRLCRLWIGDRRVAHVYWQPFAFFIGYDSALLGTETGKSRGVGQGSIMANYDL